MGSLEDAVSESVREAIEPVLEEIAELRKLISNPPPERLVVTVPEAATMLSVSERTIRNWINSGDLKAQRLGNRLYIKVVEIEGLLARA